MLNEQSKKPLNGDWVQCLIPSLFSLTFKNLLPVRLSGAEGHQLRQSVAFHISEEGSVRERCAPFRINIHLNQCQNDKQVNDDVMKNRSGPKKTTDPWGTPEMNNGVQSHNLNKMKSIKAQ